MAQLTVQEVTKTGINPTYAAAAGGGDTFLNDGKTYLHVKNGGGASINVTINSIAACNQGFDHDQVVAVTNGQERIIGPFPIAQWNDASGLVSVTYSGVTTVTVGAFKVPS